MKESLDNESLVSTAQDTLVQEGLENASEMFESDSPSLYDYKAYIESCQRRLRRANVIESLNLEFKRRTRKKIYQYGIN